VGSQPFLLSLKRRYWSLLERRRFYWRRTPDLANDLCVQVKVLVAFIRYVVLSRQVTKSKGAGAFRPGTADKTILMISYFSPPYRIASGTERIAKLAKYLSRMGWEITLLSSSPRDASEKDPQPESIASDVDVVRIQGRDLKVLAYKKLAIPDDYIGWVLPALGEAQRLAQNKNPSIIYATAPPYSNLLVGAVISRIINRPLVSDFRDPWSKIDTFWTIDRPVLRMVNRLLERAVLSASKKIVMVDQKKYCDEYFVNGRTFAYKIESISNGYDEEEFRGLSSHAGQSVSSEFTISYIGGIYDAETFANLVRPIELWQKKYPEDFDRVVFEYAGQSSEFFKKYPAKFVFRDHGYVSHRRAIELRFRSNLQLFAQPSSFKPHVSSGKVFEIIRVGVPVLAFTDPAGAVADILSRTKAGQVVQANDYNAAARALKQFYDSWKQGTITYRPDQAAISQYDRRSLARRFSDLLEKTMREL
jgi:glycosyltransferase involved in cell wall biosynthesis